MADDIARWLNGLGLGRYAEAFAESEIGFDVLAKLTDDDLRELGLSLGARRRLQAAIEALAADAPPPAPAPAPERAPDGAERRQLTVLFADLVGSTALSARLDPEDMRDVLRAYQDACAGVIARYDGYVAKLMGDGVYAYFGWPRAHEDDAERAVNAGLGIVEAVAALGRELKVRIGIATGTVAVGDIVGEGAAEEANVVGEAPNLAARLQEIAEPDSVVIGEATHALAGGLFEAADLGRRALKGFAAPVGAWAVARPRRTVSRFEATRGAHLTELVGREEEMEILLRRWHRAKAGEGQVVLISGEPGIGKSRLVHALQDRVAPVAPFVRVLQCSPQHTASALFPFIEPTIRTIGLTPRDTNSEKLEKLEAWLKVANQSPEQMAPIFGPAFGIDTSTKYGRHDVPAERQKQLLLAAFGDRLEKAAASHDGFLLAVEDAHWMDATSLEFLDSYIERGRNVAALIVVTYRPEFQAQWVGQPNVTLLTLSRFDRAHATELAANVGRGSGLAEATIERIVERADGVPLYIEELTKSVLEGDRSAIPGTLQDALEARLDRLGPAREIAQIGAVIGREFSYALLAEVAPMNAEHLRDALAHLVRSELVHVRGDPPQAVYTFKHALVQETAYGSLLRSRRSESHGLVAEAIERSLPDVAASQPEIVARHYAAAENAEDSIAYWRRAGHLAANQAADMEAIAHFRAGLEQIARLPPSQLQNELELEFTADLLSPLGQRFGPYSPETDAALTRGLELCEIVGDTPRIFPLLVGRFAYFNVASQPEKARRYAEEYLRRAEAHGDSNILAVGHRLVGVGRFRQGELAAARDHLEQALERYDFTYARSEDATAPFDLKVGALSILATVVWLLGFPEQAARRLAEAVEFANGLGNFRSQGYALMHGGAVFSTLSRDFPGAHRHACELLRLLEGETAPYYQNLCRFHIGRASIEDDEARSGLALMQGAVDARLGQGRVTYWPWHAAVYAEALIAAGALEEARETLDRALTAVDGDDERWCEAEIRRIQGECEWRADELTAAEHHFRQAIAVARSQAARSLELRAATGLARLLRLRGRTAEARGLLAPLYGWFTEGFDTADLTEAKALLEALG